MSDYQDLSKADFAVFCRNVQAKLEAHEVKCFSDEFADQLAASIAEILEPFTESIAKIEDLKTRKSALIQQRNNTRKLIDRQLSRVAAALRMVRANKMYYDMCGLHYRRSNATITAGAPQDLVAVGESNNINRLRYFGNNSRGSVVFEIWRRRGGESEWQMRAATKKQRFTDEFVTPGQFCEYRVRATSAKSVSPWSNVAVVYGAP